MTDPRQSSCTVIISKMGGSINYTFRYESNEGIIDRKTVKKFTGRFILSTLGAIRAVDLIFPVLLQFRGVIYTTTLAGFDILLYKLKSLYSTVCLGLIPRNLRVFQSQFF